MKFIHRNLIVIILLFVLAEILVQFKEIFILQTLLIIFLILFFIIKTNLKQKIFILKTSSGIFILYLSYLTILDYLYLKDTWAIYANFSIILPLLFLYIGYYFYGTKIGFENLFKQVYIASIIYILYFFIIQFLNITPDEYQSYSNTFTLGSIRNKRIYVLCYFAVTLYLSKVTGIIKNKNLKSDSIIVLILIVIIFITFRRTAWISLIIGILFSIRFIKVGQYLKIFIALGAVILIVGSFFSNIIESQFSYRKKSIEFNQSENIENDYRILEYIYIYEDIIDQPISVTIFGNKNRFNELVFWWEKNSTENSIHADFVVIIFSLGFFGLFLYLLIYYKLFLRFRNNKKLNYNKRAYSYRVILNAILLMNLSILMSGGIYRVPINGVISFLLIGSLLGNLNNLSLKNNNE